MARALEARWREELLASIGYACFRGYPDSVRAAAREHRVTRQETVWMLSVATGARATDTPERVARREVAIDWLLAEYSISAEDFPASAPGEVLARVERLGVLTERLPFDGRHTP